MAETQEKDTDQSTAPDSQISSTASLDYWNGISCDVSGMLGGFPQISRVDLRGSLNFVTKLRRLSSNCQVRNAAKLARGVDCGAGIGRVTEGLLAHVCDVVDVVEPVAKFAKCLEEGLLKKEGEEGRLGHVYVTGLQDWTPAESYDLIWNQWCVGHLTDSQLVAYFKRCGAAVSEGGWIVVKENLSTHRFGEDIFDNVDSSVTRSDQKFRDLFKEAGLQIVKAELQTGFPKGLGLYPVKMYALRPK